ncbi:DUF962-domain-containing protein [Wolfiporia cocos MD-104 SS10]|uniref:DUF962-domain-containing protein n=1 Tax=Wolfiporia cocos (strain MD-104) TaxID=742152 RepID=A0A2H3JGP6_WOLCO|nr:DUF962-domain-containing protein [Wolfiporia cocos MD-104 SS10]
MSGLFSLKKQLTFYGAYHSNSINIKIHEVCVPILIWTAQVYLAPVPTPSFFPPVHIKYNDFMMFDFKWPAVMAAVYIAYYFCLEPIAAALYLPQWAFSLLTSTAFSYHPNALKIAIAVHIVSWIAQFIGHFGPEGRSPALLDNLIGAIVLAPFFVHLEILFALGYKPQLNKELRNSISVEIARVRKMEGDKRRAKEAAKNQ